MSEDERAASGAAAECDIILKGGTTSGIVYPAAIATLATHYRLRSIGGTSAGAIAAAAAAAAELGRASGAFDRLAALPATLGETDAKGRTRLFRLFEPQASTTALFDLLVAGLMPDARHRWRAALRWLGAAVANFPLMALAIAAAARAGVLDDDDARTLADAHALLLARAIGCTLDGRSRIVARDAEIERCSERVRRVARKLGLIDV